MAYDLNALAVDCSHLQGAAIFPILIYLHNEIKANEKSEIKNFNIKNRITILLFIFIKIVSGTLRINKIIEITINSVITLENQILIRRNIPLTRLSG